jgi:hypothetical protein
MIAVYVPKQGEGTVIDRGSGIVGTPRGTRPDGEPATLCVDYEGNRYGASNIKTFADRVMHAASRHAAEYPTIARQYVFAGDMELVGWYDSGRRCVIVPDTHKAKLLDEWLDHPDDFDAEMRESRPQFVDPRTWVPLP